MSFGQGREGHLVVLDIGHAVSGHFFPAAGGKAAAVLGTDEHWLEASRHAALSAGSVEVG